jgi:unsaturated rhamnogalacturonyl hydrolase
MKPFRVPTCYMAIILIQAVACGALIPASAKSGSSNPSFKSRSPAWSGEAESRGSVLHGAGTTVHAAARAEKENIYSRKYIRTVMDRVYTWQVANPVEMNANRNNNLWARAAFYTGIMAAYRTTGDRNYLEQATKWADSREWKLGERPRHADDQAPAQTYLELYFLKKDPAKIAPTKATIDAMMSTPKPGREDWWWCDALFMAPPVLARLHAATGDGKYLDYMNTMWWDTTDFLFDREAKLYYRDKNYFGKLTPHGQKVFWARGNGWVMGGTVRVLQYLPKGNPYRERYVNLLRTMAASVSRLQGEDGLWRPSLLDPQDAPMPETSSTGFFCYAMAWASIRVISIEKLTCRSSKRPGRD